MENPLLRHHLHLLLSVHPHCLLFPPSKWRMAIYMSIAFSSPLLSRFHSLDIMCSMQSTPPLKASLSSVLSKPFKDACVVFQLLHFILCIQGMYVNGVRYTRMAMRKGCGVINSNTPLAIPSDLLFNSSLESHRGYCWYVIIHSTNQSIIQSIQSPIQSSTLDLPERSKSSLAVDLRHDGHVVFRHAQRGGGVADEERVLGITGGVTLGLEQSIEVPEGGLHELVGGHFLETHLQQNLAELSTHHQQGMQIATLGLLSKSTEIVTRDEGFGGMRLYVRLQDNFLTAIQHFLCNIGNLLATFQGELLSLHNLVVLANPRNEPTAYPTYTREIIWRRMSCLASALAGARFSVEPLLFWMVLRVSYM